MTSEPSRLPGAPTAPGAGPLPDASTYPGWSFPSGAGPTATMPPPAPPVYGEAPPVYADFPPGYGQAPAYAGAYAAPTPGVGYGYPAPAPFKRPSPVSTAALIVGGVTLIVALVPVLGLVAVPIGLVAILLGVLGVALERSRGRAVTGAVLGAVAIPLSLVMTLVAGGGLFQTSPEDVRAEVATVQELLDRGEYAQDDSVKVTFEDGYGNTTDYTVENTTDQTVAGGLFIVDAIDAHGHVIASGWGEFESLDASGSAAEYSSYVEFDADVSRAASYDVRDLDASNALYDEWWNGEDTTIST